MTTKVVTKPSRWQAWILATRPKTLTAAIVPIFVGTFLARHEVGAINWLIVFSCLFSALFIQIGTNFINDALDFKKGADTEEREGPKRATQQGWLSETQVLLSGFFSFFLSLLFGIPLIIQGGFPFFFLLLISCSLGYLYTGGRVPLAYVGLGDIFVFLFFGLVATTAAYYLQTTRINLASILAGIQIGSLSTVLIAINNLRDIAGDAKVDKRTLAVRFGKTFARFEISLLILFPFFLIPFWGMLGFPVFSFLLWGAFPIACLIVYKIWKEEPGKIYNRFLGLAALLHLLFGMLLVIGLTIFQR
jgi:1,4-dihydroxy-2-naphthoate octaprenyltransferase